jgi:NAD(P)-dependent dehydrogenase (short-subunit alcohol dehydrogenase family)
MDTASHEGRLSGRTAFITGAAAGIGAASARLFAQAGADLILVDRDREGLTAIAGELEPYGNKVLPLQVDLTDETAVEQAFIEARGTFQSLHVLFNCAGGSTGEDNVVENLTADIWTRTLELELLTVGHCSKWGVPWLRDSGGGSVINMSSFAAYRGTVRIHAYAAAKGAVSSLTRAMAGSHAADRIRVNAIAPGFALTERAKRRIQEPNVAASLTFEYDDYPFALGAPEDIAAVALFLASEESRMVNGQTIMADGGLTSY